MNWREGICTLLIITAGHDEQLFVSKQSAFNQTSINTQSKLRRSVRQLAAGHIYNHINKNMMFNQYALEEYAFAQQSRMPISWRLVSSPFRQDLYVYRESGRDAFQTAIDVFLNKSLPVA